MSVVEITPWQLFLKGGPFMWPILAGSVFSLTIVIERTLFLSFVQREIPFFKATVMEAVRKGDLKKAVDLCSASSLPLAPILRAGLLHFGEARNDIQSAMEMASLSSLRVLEKGLSFLGILLVIIPLFGFFGTIVGLGLLFRAFQLRLEVMTPVFLAELVGGVWSALIVTAFGLLVLILVSVAYYYLWGWISDIVHQMECSAVELLGVGGNMSKEADVEGE